MTKYLPKALRSETVGLNIRLNECIGSISAEKQIREMEEFARKQAMDRFDACLKFIAENHFGVKRTETTDVEAEAQKLKPRSQSQRLKSTS